MSEEPASWAEWLTSAKAPTLIRSDVQATDRPIKDGVLLGPQGGVWASSSPSLNLPQPEWQGALNATDLNNDDIYSKGLTLGGQKYIFTRREDGVVNGRSPIVTVLTRQGTTGGAVVVKTNVFIVVGIYKVQGAEEGHFVDAATARGFVEDFAARVMARYEP